MSFGVTDTGFKKMTTQDVVSDLNTKWRNAFGNDSDLSENSPNSIFIGLFADSISQVWDSLENVYNSNYRNSASGVSLDRQTNLIGMRRKQPFKSTAECVLVGDYNITIPAGSQYKQSLYNKVFETTEDYTMNLTDVNYAKFQIVVANNTLYSVSINNDVYSYTSDSDATNTEIISSLKALIEAGYTNLLVVQDGDTFTITAQDRSIYYNFASNTTCLEVGKKITVQALENGKFNVDENTIDTINTPITGTTSINNYYDGTEGGLLETDTELRRRSVQNIYTAGFSFSKAIESKILNQVQGITSAKVYENKEIVTDVNGIDPKSIECVVEGGNNVSIARVLFDNLPLGVRTNGTTSITLTDIENNSQVIKFTRPNNLYIWVNVVINSYNDEVFKPSNAVDIIKESILTFCNNSFGIGDLIQIQKIYSPIYEDAYIADVTVTLASTTGVNDTPTYAGNSINCTIRQKPNFDLTRVTVNG